ncbi:MAG: hypothetical protein P8N76_27415 [Pirellulaceae bacterium]|nr:hypothetical protein [Pirellulaceae bacterium]
MLIEQAIFTSLRGRRSQGYHLVAQSPSVDSEISGLLCKWGPSHSSLLCGSPLSESVNFSSISPDWFALSRTTHGGPEYSGRGGLQVFTRFLLLQSHQLATFENNPLALIQTARILGHMRLHLAPPTELDPIELPEHALNTHPYRPETANVPIDEVVRILQFQNRVAILGLKNPYPTLAHILQLMPKSERLGLSFTTGLKPSVHREFRLHFLQNADAAVHAHLASQGIDLVTAM